MFRDFFKNFYKVNYVEAEYRTAPSHKVIQIGGIKFKFKVSKQYIKEEKIQKIKNCVAIIAPNGIGDYMFVRQFFKYIKMSEKYKNSNLILFQQSHYINFAKQYDKDSFIDIIPFDKNLLKSFNGIRDKIKNYEFDSVINLSARRPHCLYNEKLHLQLLNLIPAKEKIVDVIGNSFERNLINPKLLEIYTKFIYTRKNVFEMERRRDFFSQLLCMELPLENIKLDSLFGKKYVVFSLMAMHKNRMFPEEKWIRIIEYVLSKTNESVKLLFVGSPVDCIHTDVILKKISDNSRCVNLCGMTDISLIPMILQNSLFLIAPETGTVHIAEAVGCRTICLCCGAHYGRFWPHKDNVTYVLPDKFKTLLDANNDNELAEFYYGNYVIDIADIKEEDVFCAVDKMIKI